MISDLRVGLFLVYSGLLLWRARGTPDGTPPDWWKMILIFAALNFLLDTAARIAYWWAGRRAIQKYRAMDPRLSRDIIFRNQSSTLMRRLGEAVEREGDAEVGGAVERFPFARSRPRWRRIELRRPGAREFIALDYDRVGIHRAVYRVLLHFGLIDESGKLRRPEE